ncbi:MAG: hypothetical protein P4L50_31010 [Anaerolineaceae bacterium]|nr:hypothetical protein [Anaerolineaceae bacterium]
MKAENKDDELDAAELSNPDDKKEGGQKKSKASKKKKVSSNHLHLPLLVEFAFSVSLLVLLLADLSIAAISFVSGANYLDIALRTVVTTIVLGVVLWLLTGRLSKGAIEAAYSSIYLEGKKSSPNGMDNEEQHSIEA